MEGRRSEELGVRASAPQVEVRVVIPRKGDAPVHLDHLVGGQMDEVRSLGLGQRGEGAAVGAGVQGLQGGLDARAGGLQVGEPLY